MTIAAIPTAIDTANWETAGADRKIEPLRSLLADFSTDAGRYPDSTARDQPAQETHSDRAGRHGEDQAPVAEVMQCDRLAQEPVVGGQQDLGNRERDGEGNEAVSAASVRICRASWFRLAPATLRTAISRARRVARAVARFMKLLQATSTTSRAMTANPYTVVRPPPGVMPPYLSLSRWTSRNGIRLYRSTLPRTGMPNCLRSTAASRIGSSAARTRRAGSRREPQIAIAAERAPQMVPSPAE